MPTINQVTPSDLVYSSGIAAGSATARRRCAEETREARQGAAIRGAFHASPPVPDTTRLPDCHRRLLRDRMAGGRAVGCARPRPAVARAPPSQEAASPRAASPQEAPSPPPSKPPSPIGGGGSGDDASHAVAHAGRYTDAARAGANAHTDADPAGCRPARHRHSLPDRHAALRADQLLELAARGERRR